MLQKKKQKDAFSLLSLSIYMGSWAWMCCRIQIRVELGFLMSRDLA